MTIRLLIQLRTVVRDKMSLLSFMLPIIAALAISNMGDMNSLSLEETQFAVIESQISESLIQELNEIGRVTSYKSYNELLSIVNDPSTEVIGILGNKEILEIILSGDETSRIKDLASKMPELLNFKVQGQLEVSKLKKNSVLDDFRHVIDALIILMSLFIGSTFNAMNVIYEKEEGIIHINKILPSKFQDYLYEKISIGLITSVLVSLITTSIIVGNIKDLLLICPMIIFTSFISSLLGLMIGRVSNSFVGVISNIKLTMVAFMALPIMAYLFLDGHKLKVLFNVLPSFPVFYGLINIFEGNYRLMLISLLIIILHCIFLFSIYKKLYRKRYIND